MPIKNPPNPGDFIRTEIIEPAGLNVTAASAAPQVLRPALSSLLNGKADLCGEMALRIEKAFGIKMDTLMRMQSAYDIAPDAQTRKRKSACAESTPSYIRDATPLRLIPLHPHQRLRHSSQPLPHNLRIRKQLPHLARVQQPDVA